MPTEKRPSKVEGGDATPTRRRAGERSPLLRPDWRYVEPCNMDDYRAEDWAVMNRQRAEYLEEQQAVQVLDMLKASRDAPTFGYLINNYEHCLQTATLLHEDGHDEETVVTGLLHDIGLPCVPRITGGSRRTCYGRMSPRGISGRLSTTRCFSVSTCTGTSTWKTRRSSMSETAGEIIRTMHGRPNSSRATTSRR